MRQALLDDLRRERRGVARVLHTPAPVGGWNTRDALAAMAPTDAVQLTNVFPSIGEVVLRGGSLVAATCSLQASENRTIWSLYQYATVGGTAKLFAVNDAGIFDVSPGGTIATPVRTLTNGKWNALQFTNSAGGHFLWGVNGSDKPTMYDGTTWTQIDSGTTPSLTGVDGTTLIWPWVFKRRIWAIQKDSLDAWYLPLDSIAGAAVKFPLGPVFERGGYLVSATNWTVDGGKGADDFLVLVSSQGEVAVYEGSDPASAGGMALIGVYYVGRPLGHRCFLRYGGDVVLLTEQGAMPLSSALKSTAIDYSKAVSNKIQPSFIAAGGLYRPNFGWEAILFPPLNALIVNVPVVEGSRSIQFVMNTLTQAWCDFNGWNATCFEFFNDDLYFGSAGGKVYKAWRVDIPNDSGLEIIGTAQQAFNYFTKRPALKVVEGFRPLLSFDNSFGLRWGLMKDYDPAAFTGSRPSIAVSGVSVWDLATWDVSNWSTTEARSKQWVSPRCDAGYAFSLALEISSHSARMAWAGTDFLVGLGGALG